ncbi:MAG: rod shape-determining protein [Candidatus Dormibacteraeota bacterium]|nr:rod shape-determining protein [Candidatus Dormibacteraeota bacterium]MBO0704011.1 rod shape-determining protein [Candidatus Dormibacteraeota bacterium]MBO0760361.1 rod shape-determining protein [Candidatus Dormibacteraeota bacterium]
MIAAGLWSGLGIDLGTANTVVAHPRRGLVLNEPSVMVVRADDHKRRRPMLIGAEARELIGRVPDGLAAVHPLRDGVVTDLQLTRAFIVAILRRVTARQWERWWSRAVIGFPTGATALERRALVEAAQEAGIRNAALVPEPVAGALGTGVDPLDSRAHMVVDVGGGTAEATCFCFGGILASRSCRVAGDEMTLALSQHLREEHQVVVGELTAEDLKARLADGSGPIVVEGQDAASNRARLVTLDPDELADAIRPTLDSVLKTLGDCLEDLPPQPVGDILHEGLVVFGGGSLLRGFDRRLEETFGFPVRVVERPLTCVAEGAAACLRRPEVIDAYGQT